MNAQLRPSAVQVHDMAEVAGFVALYEAMLRRRSPDAAEQAAYLAALDLLERSPLPIPSSLGGRGQ